MIKLNTHMWFILFVVMFVAGGITYADPVRQDTITKYYSISPTAFVPQSDNYEYRRYHDRIYGVNAGETFYAPIYLPDSAQVIEFKAWVYDSDPDDDMSLGLVRTAFAGGMSTMSRITSSGDIGQQELIDTTIENNLIDNTTYKYSADVIMPAIGTEHTLYAMRITYEMNQGSPAVNEVSEEIHSEAVNTIYPMPFSHYTLINYHVPIQENVSIKIYDEAGRLIKTLIDNTIPQGSYTARWDGKDSNGRKVATGSYFFVVKTNGSNSTKVVHIK